MPDQTATLRSKFQRLRLHSTDQSAHCRIQNRHQLLVGRVLAMVLARRYFDQYDVSRPNPINTLEPIKPRLETIIKTAIKAEPRSRPLPDLLIPIPLHPTRLKFRGFNQAHEIADAIKALTGIPIDDQLCQRITESPPQKGLSAAARRRNIKQAFRLTRKLRGERLALVDDVLTTGATVSELTRSALNAGAGSVLGRDHYPGQNVQTQILLKTLKVFPTLC